MKNYATLTLVIFLSFFITKDSGATNIMLSCEKVSDGYSLIKTNKEKIRILNDKFHINIENFSYNSGTVYTYYMKAKFEEARLLQDNIDTLYISYEIPALRKPDTFKYIFFISRDDLTMSIRHGQWEKIRLDYNYRDSLFRRNTWPLEYECKKLSSRKSFVEHMNEHNEKLSKLYEKEDKKTQKENERYRKEREKKIKDRAF